jgi:hypothetical protein
MFFATFRASFPSVKTLAMVSVSSVFGGLVSFVLCALILPTGPAQKPLPPHDPRFATLGRAYLPRLGQAYAVAWEDGAKLLESGQGIATALDTVKNSWESNRASLFDRMLTPEFDKLVPEATKDSDVSSQARGALAAAWRGFALGLRR